MDNKMQLRGTAVVLGRNESWTMPDKQQGKCDSPGEQIWQNRPEDMDLKNRGGSQARATIYAPRDTQVK